MNVNDDFSRRAVVHAAKLPWQASPMPGVERRMLDRLGDEVARATTIVRYAPNSHFSPHVHTGGEEFLVLEGVFQDEHGDFAAGSYIRNPPQSSHTPGSKQGCTIFVKLWQFDVDDRNEVKIDTHQREFTGDLQRPGVEVMPLFKDAREDVRLERWAPDSEIELDAPNGLEVLVLAGSFVEQEETFGVHSWLRLPRNSRSFAIAGPEGARVWVKKDHLATDPLPPATG